MVIQIRIIIKLNKTFTIFRKARLEIQTIVELELTANIFLYQLLSTIPCLYQLKHNTVTKATVIYPLEVMKHQCLLRQRLDQARL